MTIALIILILLTLIYSIYSRTQQETRITNLEENLTLLDTLVKSEDTLSDILFGWDQLYSESDKHQKRKMTMDRQKYGIKVAAGMHGVKA